jgi:hypothetical protein
VRVVTGALLGPLEEPPLEPDACEALVRVVTGALDPLELWLADDGLEECEALVRVVTGALDPLGPAEPDATLPLAPLPPLVRVATAPLPPAEPL